MFIQADGLLRPALLESDVAENRQSKGIAGVVLHHPAKTLGRFVVVPHAPGAHRQDSLHQPILSFIGFQEQGQLLGGFRSPNQRKGGRSQGVCIQG